MEPFPGADPGDASLPRTRGRRSEGRALGKRDSDAHCIASKASGLPVTPFPTGALPRVELGSRAYRARVDAGPEGAAWLTLVSLNGALGRT